MNSFGCIEQRGIVESIDKNIVSVRISQVSACSECHSRSSCTIFGTGEKTILVENTTNDFHPGDRVGIVISRAMGNKAVLLGYFIPFLLVILTLIFFTALHFREWQSGLLALASLIPYYIILNLKRSKLRRSFTFTLKKLV